MAVIDVLNNAGAPLLDNDPGWTFAVQFPVGTGIGGQKLGNDPWVVGEDGGGNQLFDYRLAEGTSGTSWSVASVPLPAAAWLFGSALLGLGVIKRKKA